MSVMLSDFGHLARQFSGGVIEMIPATQTQHRVLKNAATT
jgi:hypothetical protein